MAGDEVQSRFTAFFRDLAIAWRAVSSYPEGHPAASEGLDKACKALGDLLCETGPIELAAAREALLWHDRRFTSPTAVQLARLLRRRRAAGLAIDPGVTPRELEILLQSLSLDVKSAREAGSLATELVEAGLVRLRVADLDFSSVALVEGDDEIAAPEAGAFSSRVLRRAVHQGALPAEQLAGWLASGRSASDLLNLLLDSGGAGSGSGGSGGSGGSAGPGASGASGDPSASGGSAGASGSSLEAPGSGTAQAGPGPPPSTFPRPPHLLRAVLQAAAAELIEAPDAERAAAFAVLHQRLGGADRSRLLSDLAAAVGRQIAARELLSQVTDLLPEALGAELRQAIGRAAISDLMGERPAGAPSSAPGFAPLAGLRSAFLTDDLDPLLAGELPPRALDLLFELPADDADFVLPPGAAEIAREIAAASSERAAAGILLELAENPDLSPEVLPPLLLRLDHAYRRLLGGGRIRQAQALVARIQQSAAGDDPRALAFRRSADRLAARESLAALVPALPELSEEALGLVPRLLDQLGPTAVRHLLGFLAEADNRRLRHLLLDLLARLGPAVVRDATALLGDSRWYVVRNVLLLLRRVGDPGSVPAVRRCADHPDLRVRLEAIRNLFAFDKEVPSELLRRALTHRDPRQAEAAMELAGEHGITEAVEPIVAYLRSADLLGWRRGVRLKALRALAAIGDPAALAGLGRFRARFQLLPPALEERRELYRTLRSYPEEARRPWIESGLRSRDPEIRRLSEALARLDSESAPPGGAERPAPPPATPPATPGTAT